MSDPKDHEEYSRLANQNCYVEGRGLDTETVTCCPFCAAPEFMRAKVVNYPEDLEKNRTCKACGRSAKATVKRDSGGISFEIVQTGGPDQPEWLVPKMRRVDQ